MITRLVKLTFVKGREQEFLDIYRASEERIRNFEGCSHLELLRDVHDASVFFTYSHWESEQHLMEYRNSELFRSVWSRVTPLFAAEPQAWSARTADIRQS